MLTNKRNVKYIVLIQTCLLMLCSCSKSETPPDNSVQSPATLNKTPIAVISETQIVSSNTEIIINGTSSSDPDRDVLSYRWSFKSKPTSSSAQFIKLKDNNEIVSFNSDAVGDYIIELVVNDGINDSKPVSTVVTRLYSKPVAIIGKNRAVSLLSQVLLDGSNSTAADINNLKYNWMLRSKPLNSKAILVQNNSFDPTASFDADKEGEFVIELVVDDGIEVSLTEIIKIYSYNGVVIYFNDFSGNTLSDFNVQERGTGKLLIENEQLRINPGKGYLNSAGIILDTANKLSGYNSQLSSNTGIITWAFNISNMDGKFNNYFSFTLSSEILISDPATYGYAFSGGGYVGDRMMFSRIAHSQSPFSNVSEIIFDTNYGLGVLPKMGAIKITFNPINSEWKIYYKVGTQKIDPVLITNLIGSGINSGFVSESLPYLIFKGKETGTTFFDNITILINN